MQQNRILNSATMVAENHFKNGASLKSLMSRGNILKMFFIVTILGLLFSCRDKINDIEKQNDDNISKETIIAFQEDGETYSIHAFEGKVVVYFKDEVDFSTAQKTISNLGGTIIEQIPSIGYYYVEVGAGNETSFISKIKDKNVEYAALSLVCELYEIQTNIFDYFELRNYEVGTHGDKVKSVYDKCVGESLKSKAVNVGLNWGNDESTLRLNQEEVLYQISESRKYTKDDMLCNISLGPKPKSKLSWGSMTEKQQDDYVMSIQLFIKKLVVHLEQEGNGKSPNIVVTLAAGNIGMPNYYESVINPMITRRPPVANNGDVTDCKLNDIQREILMKNILIVTSTESSTNKSGTYGDVAKVNIDGLKYKEKQLKGSSFAAPKALCMIRQVMREKNISAVEALAKVKQSIAVNNGVLLDDVKKILNLSIEKPVETETNGLANTTWTYRVVFPEWGKYSGTISLLEDGIADLVDWSRGTWLLNNGNSISIRFVGEYNTSVSFNGTVNSTKDEIKGSCIWVMCWDEGDNEAFTGTFSMNKK